MKIFEQKSPMIWGRGLYAEKNNCRVTFINQSVESPLLHVVVQGKKRRACMEILAEIAGILRSLPGYEGTPPIKVFFEYNTELTIQECIEAKANGKKIERNQHTFDPINILIHAGLEDRATFEWEMDSNDERKWKKKGNYYGRKFQCFG